MAPPPGALQRAALVAVPLALVALIIVTPGMIGRDQPPTAIPFLLIEPAGEAWNATYNETALLYVRSALGDLVYDYIAINVTGVGPYEGTQWSSEDTRVPSLALKYPVNATAVGNVTAVAVEEHAIFWYNATVEFLFDERGWVLRVQPEGATAPRDYEDVFKLSMRREAKP